MRYTSAEWGKDPEFLLLGEKKNRRVSSRLLSQEIPTQTMIRVSDEEMQVHLGTILYDAAGEQMKMGCIVGMDSPVNLPALYRIYNLFTAMQTVSIEETGYAMSYAFSRGELGIAEAELVASLMLDVGLKQFDEIMSAPLPPDFITLARAIIDKGLTIDVDALTDEVEASRLEYAAELKELGVEHPSKRRERFARQEEFLTPLRPHFEAFVASPYGAILGKNGAKQMDAYALMLHRHGVTEVDALVGAAAFVALASVADSLNRLSMLGAALIGHSAERLTSDDVVNGVARFCTERFKDRKPRLRRQEYRRLINDTIDQTMDGEVVNDDL